MPGAPASAAAITPATQFVTVVVPIVGVRSSAVTEQTTKTLCATLEIRPKTRAPSAKRNSSSQSEDREEAEEARHDHRHRLSGDESKDAGAG